MKYHWIIILAALFLELVLDLVGESVESESFEV